MDWILEERLAIGTVVEARRVDVLRAGAFRSVLALIESTADEDELAQAGLQEIEVESVPLIDGPGNDPDRLERARRILADLVENAAPVLVHCQAGRSRSVVVVAAYLAHARGLGADDALAFVTERREAAVQPALAELLRRSVANR